MNKYEKMNKYPKAMYLKEYDPKFFKKIKKQKLALVDYFLTAHTQKDQLIDRVKVLQLANETLIKENISLSNHINDADHCIDKLKEILEHKNNLIERLSDRVFHRCRKEGLFNGKR